MMSDEPFTLSDTDDSAKFAAKVALDLSLDRPLDYLVPDALASQIEIGVRVEVPVRNGIRPGYVLEIYPAEEAEFKGKLRPIRGLCAGHARIPKPLIELGQWMATYYCCPQEAAMRTLLPGAVRSGKIKPRTVSWIRVADAVSVTGFIDQNAKRKKAQVAALEKIKEFTDGGEKQALMSTCAISAAVLKSLVGAGVVIVEERLASDASDGPEIVRTDALQLTVQQQDAVDALHRMMADRFDGPRAEPHTMLLFGITGSGKTEVYLQAIAHAIAQGKQAIVLVPEIALTPQTVDRFRSRFGDAVSVLHSALTDRDRFNEWSRINEGRVSIAVGARSVLFAPFRDVGLIIVDEEHESTYKQTEAPRYHARDVAVMRGLMENAVVVLGSATPSFESYENAVKGRYVLARLDQRADASQLPSTEVADMRLETTEEGTPLFSKRLKEAIYDRLTRKEQTILFLNRRGFARQLMCDNCGYTAQCDHCSVTYTYHKHNERLICHWCGATMGAPAVCPACGDKHIRYTGSGTEKIEGILAKLFPSAVIARMDSDTMSTAKDYEDALYAFRRGTTDILLGTQMIAKGLHFPKVTLVGILNADLSLTVPDFRAEERTFQLLTQVAGRAGRGDIHGEVIVQTRSPHNPAIQCALEHDFDAFWESEYPLRSDLMYPPCCRMIAIHFRGDDLKRVIEASKTFRERLHPALHSEVECTDPMPAPLERIKGKYRYLITLKGHKLTGIRALIRHEVCHGKYPPGVDIHADVDPVSIM